MEAEKSDVMQIFAQNLKKYRTNAGLTQKQLSEQLEISQKHLSFLETGTQFASASLIDKICDELKISCGDLFSSEKDINHKEVNLIFTMIQNSVVKRLTILESKLESLEEKLGK